MVCHHPAHRRRQHRRRHLLFSCKQIRILIIIFDMQNKRKETPFVQHLHSDEIRSKLETNVMQFGNCLQCVLQNL